MAESTVREQQARTASGLGQAVRWAAVSVVLVYAAWAIGVALTTPIGSPAGDAVRTRAVPPFFVLHALAGAAALGGGALQLSFARRWSSGRAALHRVLGRVYVVAATTTALAALVVGARFDVGLPARAAFALEAAAWAGATLIAFTFARRRQFKAHERWMIRSYGLAVFFVTFSFVHPLVGGLGWSRTAEYALSVAISLVLNVAAGEVWLRRSARLGVGTR